LFGKSKAVNAFQNELEPAYFEARAENSSRGTPMPEGRASPWWDLRSRINDIFRIGPRAISAIESSQKPESFVLHRVLA
jgi:hypothetical protein